MNQRRRPGSRHWKPALSAAGAWLAASTVVAAAFAAPAPDPPIEPAPVDVSAAPAPPPTIADREPYVRWADHTGKAHEAVVHVRVEVRDYLTGEAQVREGSGFVVRCDGFVLVPTGLLSPTMRLTSGITRRANLKDKVNLLTFAAGDGRTPPPQRVLHPRFFRDRVPYALVKINDHHVKSLPMLAPANVKEGMAVRVVYARPAEGAPHRAEAVTVDATIGKAEGEGDKRFAFAGPAPRVPPGALVVDAASGLAVGMVPGPGSAFATFADFPAISNAVALLPDPSAPGEEPGQSAGAPARAGMVWVPGGATALPKNMTLEYAALYGKWVACTPGFWIDRREVTNGEYREFLTATGYRPLPAGWSAAELAGPGARSPHLPVTGVTTEDAAAYAAWRGKRLVTPVEWVRASRGAGGGWLAEYTLALKQAEATLRQALGAFARAESDQAMLAAAELRRRGIPVRPGATIHNSELQRIAEERRLFVWELIETFNRRFANPLLVAGAGMREEDQSVYGVRDVAMNVPELLLPNRAYRPVEVAPKLLTPHYDPDRMPRWAERVLAEADQRAGVYSRSLRGAGIPGEAVAPWLGGETVRRARSLGNAAGARVAGSLLPFPAADPALDPGAAQAAALIGAGFRCAR